MPPSSSKGSYAKVVWEHRSFGAFRSAFESASQAAMLEAGEAGKDLAQHLEAPHNRTGATNRGIGFTLFGRGIAFFVKTAQGVFIEYGTKERSGPRGSVKADPYLRPAMMMAGKLVPGYVRRHMAGHGLTMFRRGGRSGQFQTRTSRGRFGPRP